MRVYLPATLPLLRRVYARGEVGPPPLTAFAVTAALREWYVEGNDEELEYAALTEAARASLRLVDADPDAPPRRVVLAAEVPDEAVTSLADVERAAVLLTTAVPMTAVAAVHVDGDEARADVRAAAAVVVEADLGDEDAQFTVAGAEGHELLWYATQEIPELL